MGRIFLFLLPKVETAADFEAILDCRYVINGMGGNVRATVTDKHAHRIQTDRESEKKNRLGGPDGQANMIEPACSHTTASEAAANWISTEYKKFNQIHLGKSSCY